MSCAYCFPRHCPVVAETAINQNLVRLCILWYQLAHVLLLTCSYELGHGIPSLMLMVPVLQLQLLLVQVCSQAAICLSEEEHQGAADASS